MASIATSELQPVEEYKDKGLKSGALGLVSSIVMGVASTAPAYSLAATLFFVFAAVGLKSPAVAFLAFIPMLLCSIGYSEMNKADPDCGTTFTWATRAFGPKTGWAGGWAIVAADILVMASLAQVAGQYMFLLFGADGIGDNATSPWVLLTGIAWIVAMTYICYRGIEVSAWFQRILLTIEIIMLLVLAVTALVKTEVNHPEGSVPPSFSWLLPTHLSLSAFITGIILMLFIYWGWDTAVSINEETKDKAKTPGRAAIISTVILLITYVIVIFGIQSFAGTGTTGIGLANQAHEFDVLSVAGTAIFGGGGFGTFLSRLLILMVLTSASASTQTTILPTARTTLSMAAYKAIPAAFAKIHPRYLTPTVSTIVMGLVSIALYIPFNYIAGGNPIGDAVTGDRTLHRLLLRADCLLLRLVLPENPDQQHPQPVYAGHPALPRRPDHVRGRHLQPAERLGGEQQPHQLDHTGPAVASRRDLPDRRRGRTGRRARIHLHAGDRARVLQEADPDPGHPDPGTRAVAHLTRVLPSHKARPAHQAPPCLPHAPPRVAPEPMKVTCYR